MVGDYAWEAGPTCDDDLLAWSDALVWHAGEQIERVLFTILLVAFSPPPLPPCPFQ